MLMCLEGVISTNVLLSGELHRKRVAEVANTRVISCNRMSHEGTIRQAKIPLSTTKGGRYYSLLNLTSTRPLSIHTINGITTSA